MTTTEDYVLRHERCLQQVFHDKDIPSRALADAVHYVINTGGKRIRPVLVYFMGALVNVPVEILDVIGCAVEITHGYSLVHDDLPAMDDDDFRRGKPSCHKAFGEACAILVGDGMQAWAVECLLRGLTDYLPLNQVVNIALHLLHASGLSGMVSGQHLDLVLMSDSCVTSEQLRLIHHLKTGQLITACAQMVVAAGSPEKTYQQALLSYAHQLGFAFQLQDDYLDCYGPEGYLGKNRRSDEANKKTTFATLLSQVQLEQAVSMHYQQAMHALAPFNEKAYTLIEFTQKLQGRSLINA